MPSLGPAWRIIGQGLVQRMGVTRGERCRNRICPLCAEREIFEETGITATAGDLAKIFDNGFHLYWCEVPASAQPKIHRPLEVREVAWWQPEAVSAQAWRYPDQGAMIRDLVTARRLPATH